MQEHGITPPYTGVQHNEDVNYSLQIEQTDTKDGELVHFGPVDPETRRQLSIPSTFERAVTLADRGLKLTLTCAFTGEKVEVSQLFIVANQEDKISSRDLAQLGLPSLIHAATKSAVADWEYWVPGEGEQEHLRHEKSNYAFLAQVYWLQHISQGNPRQTLMNYLDIPRSTCNLMLRNIKKNFALPG